MHSWKLKIRKVRSLAQDPEPPSPQSSLSRSPWLSTLALGTQNRAGWCRPQDVFLAAESPALLPCSLGQASHGAMNSRLTYLRLGPHVQPLLGLIHSSLSPRSAKRSSPIFHPSRLGPCQGCAVSSPLFSMCEAICQNSGPRAPGAGEETSSKARQRQPLSPGPTGQNRLRGLARWQHQLPGGTPAQEGEG